MQNHSLPLSIIRVSGDDAITFLQGQLTQDVNNLNQRWRYTAQCNPQGRVIAFFMIYELQQGNDRNIYLITDNESADATILHLEKYVMRSQVNFDKLKYNSYFIESETNKNENAEDQLQTTEQSIKLLDDNTKDDSVILTLSYGELFIINPALHKEPEKPSNPAQWRSANIDNKLPFLTKKALGKFTPEAINLDLLGAVSFKKGCYTGQEIVARMHYLGKAKKRLFPVKITGKLEQINVADNITDKEGKTIGHLVDFEPNGNALISIKVTQEITLNQNKKTIQSVNGQLML